jgi:hypothetical protein
MKQIQIKFLTREKVREFNKMMQTLPGEYDLAVGRVDIDAKSALGVMSLDFTRVLTLTIYEDEEYPWVLDKLKVFQV